jgi:hypothetical protein
MPVCGLVAIVPLPGPPGYALNREPNEVTPPWTPLIPIALAVAVTPSAPAVPAATTIAIGNAATSSARETQRSARAPPPAPVPPGLDVAAVATFPDPPLEPLGMQTIRARPPGGICDGSVHVVVPTGKSPLLVDS